MHRPDVHHVQSLEPGRALLELSEDGLPLFPVSLRLLAVTDKPKAAAGRGRGMTAPGRNHPPGKRAARRATSRSGPDGQGLRLDHHGELPGALPGRARGPARRGGPVEAVAPGVEPGRGHRAPGGRRRDLLSGTDAAGGTRGEPQLPGVQEEGPTTLKTLFLRLFTHYGSHLAQMRRVKRQYLVRP